MRTITKVFNVFMLAELTEAAKQAAYAEWSENPWLAEFASDSTKEYLQDEWAGRGVEIETIAENRRGLFIVATLDIDKFLSVAENSNHPFFAELAALKSTPDYESGLEIRLNGESYNPGIDFPDWFYDSGRFIALDETAEELLSYLTRYVKMTIEEEEAFAYSFESFAEESASMGHEYLENGDLFQG